MILRLDQIVKIVITKSAIHGIHKVQLIDEKNDKIDDYYQAVLIVPPGTGKVFYEGLHVTGRVLRIKGTSLDLLYQKNV
nr:orf25b [Trichoplusia ni single nucleopolyhedrovirus]